MVFKSTYDDIIPDEKYKDSLSLFYWHQLDKFATKTLLVDYLSGRKWNGAQIKQFSSKVANYLLLEVAQFKDNPNCVFFYPNSDLTQLVSIGVLFAGGSVCAGAPEDPEYEHNYMINLMKPSVVFACQSLLDQLMKIRSQSHLNFKICIINYDDGRQDSPDGSHIDLKRDICQFQARAGELPILVAPDAPAYVLLTSGSTGNPKPVGRSQRNSLYVCHSLNNCGHELWDLDESSVFAGHLPLDHGTGIFSVKMTIARGMQLILMPTYEEWMLLEAIERYKITDLLLGSAFLHNLMNENLLAAGSGREQPSLSSLRNMISVGSPLPSHELACKFMRKHQSRISVRQCLGMTECGFTSFVKRSDCFNEAQSVGWLLPNITAKLVDLESGQEIEQFDKEGELYLGGPTVSPGYIGQQFEEQKRLAFVQGGFYRTFDVCFVRPDGQLVIRGRRNDILCLGDGYKVLPGEIEQVLMKHEAILEAAVVGIPHPSLKTCHAPRAYVVPRKEFANKLSCEEVIEFAKANLSEPKHLVGGVKLMPEGLPRITIGKVDKRLLKQSEGYL